MEDQSSSAIADKAKRVAVFMYDFALSGVVANAVRLANAVAAEGHDVRLIVCRDDGRAAHAIDPRVAIERVGGSAVSSRGFDLIKRIPALRKVLRRIRPDILLSAGNHGHVPMILASAGLDGVERVLRLSNEPDHPGDNALVRELRTVILRGLVRAADQLMLVSPRLARHPVVARAAREGRTVLTPNGVAVDDIRRKADDPCLHPWVNGSEPLLVAVGRLARQKNLPTLFRALAIACHTRPMRLIVIGRGASDMRTRLEELANELGVGDRIDMIGEQSNPFPFVRAADVFVMPSLWEGRSNALLEAMACNVPIVAAHTAGDAPEVLGYGRYGLLVHPTDAAALADAILLQAGPERCLPGDRIADYALANTLPVAVSALLGRA